MTVLIYLVPIVLLILLSAFFSGSETGVYRLSRVRVRIGYEKGKRSYQVLFKLLKDGQGLILTLLLGNNLVNYFLTSLVTVAFLTRIEDPHLAEVYATVALTPTLFIFGELIPKNLMYYQADQLLPRCSWFIWGVDRLFLFSGVKGLLKKISTVLSRLFCLQMDTAKAIDMSHRHQVRQIIHETQEEGLLSQTQREMMTRLMNFPSISVASVMIHLRDTHKIPVSISHNDLLAHLAKSPFTRQVVYGESPMDILGYVTIYDVLSTEPGKKRIQENLIHLQTMDKKTSVIEAINRMRNRRERIALVVETVRKETRPVGIITIADLVEEITGELNV